MRERTAAVYEKLLPCAIKAGGMQVETRDASDT